MEDEWPDGKPISSLPIPPAMPAEAPKPPATVRAARPVSVGTPSVVEAEFPPLIGAGFFRRWASVVIDSLLITVLAVPVMLGVFVILPTERVRCADGSGVCDEPTETGLLMLPLTALVIVLMVLWYIAEFEGNRGATLGRRAMRLRVVSEGTANRIGSGRALLRLFTKPISSSVFGLGYLWMLWDPKKQTWHDKLARAQVVTLVAPVEPALSEAALSEAALSEPVAPEPAASSVPLGGSYPFHSYASWGQRVAARIIDSIVVSVYLVGSAFLAGVLLAWLPREAPTPCTLNGETRLCEDPTGASILIVVAVTLTLVLGFIYFWFWRLEGATGQTPGRRVVGIRLVKVSNLRPIGGGLAFARYLVQALIGLLFVIGPLLNLLWPLWDERRQTWHDKVVGSVVVEV
ncbi:MAG: RDD family protein [Actinomycetota bacterium]